MTQALTVQIDQVPARVAHGAENAARFAAMSRSENTVRAYNAAWRDFADWCEGNGLASLPASPATVAAFLGDRADGLSVSSLHLRVAAISQAHEETGADNPTQDGRVRKVLKGIRRDKGTAPSRKAALMTAHIKAMMDHIPAGPIGYRDRALLLLGFAGGFRRSELVALNVEDVEEVEDGLAVTLRRSKTDQEGKGRVIGIPRGIHPETCPVEAVREWVATMNATDGPLFRRLRKNEEVQDARLSDRGVARVVQKYIEAIGLEAAKFGGHSLRRGHCTQAAANGKGERAIARQTGHKSMTVLRGYIEDGSVFQDNTGAALGL